MEKIKMKRVALKGEALKTVAANVAAYLIKNKKRGNCTREVRHAMRRIEKAQEAELQQKKEAAAKKVAAKAASLRKTKERKALLVVAHILCGNTITKADQSLLRILSSEFFKSLRNAMGSLAFIRDAVNDGVRFSGRLVTTGLQKVAESTQEVFSTVWNCAKDLNKHSLFRA